jgi:microcystin-dependent protein|tara:strand:- start:581 stop:1357 length:777 start_codon:yes stop_codon:yes gene_type:complete
MATYEARKYGIIPINATQIADGTVTNSEYQFINSLSSNAQTQISSKLTAAGAFTIATGMILPWAAALADKPAGYLNCDGSVVSRSTYSALFAVISTTFGSGDGSSTFGLPNFQNRMAIGKSGTYALGSTGGATTDSFTPSGSISGSTGGTALTISQLPSHNHSATSTSSSSSSTSDGVLTTGSGSGPGGGGANIISGNQSTRPVTGITTSTTTTTSTSIGNTGSGATHNHTLSASFSGSAGTVDVLNPYISINFIIKA